MVCTASAPDAGTTAVYHTSNPAYDPQLGALGGFVLLAQLVLVAIMAHAALTVSGTAPQGPSFAGGGGAGEQVIWIVPHKAAFNVQGLPALLLNTRIRNVPVVVGMNVSVA